MKLQYLGTAAFEGIPAMFCECDVCRKAKKLGGRDIRTRSQAILDDKLLIDFPADTYAHYLKYNIPLEKIKTCLITHSHCDHLYADDMASRGPGFAHRSEAVPMTVYSAKASCDIIKSHNIPQEIVNPIMIEPFKPFEAEGYTITALNATHDPSSDPYIYLIENDGKAILYSNDTDIYPEDTWEYLSKYDKTINLVSFDCTKCASPRTYTGHLSVDDCIDIRKRFTEMGIVNDKTIYVLNHFSHNGEKCLYDDLVKYVEKDNFIVSYDGMVIEF